MARGDIEYIERFWRIDAPFKARYLSLPKAAAEDRHFDELALKLGLGRPISGVGSRPVLQSAFGTSNSSPASLSRVSPNPGLGTSPDAILRAGRTISVSSMTMFLKPDQLEDELRKRPEYEAMRLAIVKDATKADLMIDLQRLVFTYTFTYSVSSADNRVVVMSGKVIAFDGNFAAPKIANELIKRFRAAREGQINQPLLK